VAVVLPIGVPVPGEEDLLASRKHPQDETGQGLAGDLVADRAGLGLADLSVRQHVDLQTLNQIEPKPHQLKSEFEAVRKYTLSQIRAATAILDHIAVIVEWSEK
jgi:hypothetical protein